MHGDPTPADRPWLRLYPRHLDPTPRVPQASIPDVWAARVESAPDGPAIRYFDATLTARQLDRASDALAVALQHRGVARGARVALYMQNIPHYPLALLAVWKVGAIAVPLNPMYKGEELRRLIDDSDAIGIIAADAPEAELAETLAGSTITWMLSCSDRDFQTLDDPRVFSAPPAAAFSGGEVAEVLRAFDGQRPSPIALSPDDIAFVTYTSGTTGPPKGALNSHGNFLSSASNFSAWIDVEPGDAVLAMAPLFHITGLVLNAGVALLNDAILVLAGRFNPQVAVEAIQSHRVTFTIGSITAFNAILALDGARPEHFASIKHLFSGGAPIPPATITAFQQRFGHYLHNAWGMTETTAGGVAVPPGATAPVHAASGTLSIGVAMQNADVRVVDVDGAALPPGEEGELEFTAPQVVRGYWQNPEATARTFPGGRLRTGDVAVIDPDGWIYLVDRMKDVIIASGFKVWPREVEDVLYRHPAVFEAAVIGEPDPYRGETVVAYVSLVPGQTATPDELIAFSKEHLAAYKYPRRVNVVDELPKTATGKIRRNSVREASASVEGA